MMTFDGPLLLTWGIVLAVFMGLDMISRLNEVVGRGSGKGLGKKVQ